MLAGDKEDYGGSRQACHPKPKYELSRLLVFEQAVRRNVSVATAPLRSRVHDFRPGDQSTLAVSPTIHNLLDFRRGMLGSIAAIGG